MRLLGHGVLQLIVLLRLLWLCLSFALVLLWLCFCSGFALALLWLLILILDAPLNHAGRTQA
ncbi:hypothetical protein C1Y26_31085 [Pseudomonas sp. MPR-R2A7]|nr:hypothetical protein C1Y24_33675 [Pseudomonas sp. MPR-R2A4]PMX33252.1 hypothetical protein C1Y26_31085 [Pseudomonas sp. MPR-R2A7]PMX49242.1 hypothetical protein C1Y17_28045 [Pseudomonas sp. MPR-R2A6]PMX81118.1 hypothetical protein C1Y21_33055 [Pseudomonas sp. MPR-R2A3]PNA19423.1 hypothetical protein C1Y16_34325 [Pseudomonas sp. MPR-ANB1]